MKTVHQFMVGCAAVISRPDPGSRRRVVLLGLRIGDPSLWSLPGGRVEPGEQFAAAIAREAREECGIALPPGITVDRIVHRTDVGSVEVIAVAEHEVDGATESVNGEPDRFVEWRWFPIDGLPAPLFPPTAAVLLKHNSPRLGQPSPPTWTYTIENAS